ncbi:MAG: hypothetical protein Fur0032_05290 [Terrimicrobiaceae bacterium]
MADVAREAGVSKNAVSLALRGDPQIPLPTRERIRGVAARMGYRRDPVVAELMARLRRGHSAGGERLALVNAHEDPTALKTHPTIPVYVEGCRRRALECGFGLEEFWLHDEEIRGPRLVSVLRARGIRGVLLVGLMRSNRIPSHFLPVTDSFAVVVTGVRTTQPVLSFASVDHYMLVMRALEEVAAMGYRRPALVMDEGIDDLVERGGSAAFREGIRRLPEADRLAPFRAVEAAWREPAVFHRWVANRRPDVVLALYNFVRSWLDGWKGAPAFVQLEWRATRPEIPGMDQHNDETGAAAVDLLINQLHSGEWGVPKMPRSTMIEATWVRGQAG